MDRANRRNVVRDPMLRPSRAYVSRPLLRPVRHSSTKPGLSAYRTSPLVDKVVNTTPTSGIQPKKSQSAPKIISQRPNAVRQQKTQNTQTAIETVEPAVIETFPVAKEASKTSGRSYSKLQIMFTAMAVFVFIFGIGVSIDGWRTNKNIEAQATNSVSRSDGQNELDDAEVSADALKSHTVAPDAPRYITIDKFKTKARVKAVDTKADGELEAPRNIFDVGWYRSGAKPGSDGAVLLDGHVSSPRKAGVFKNISKLVAGDVITVERGDGQIFKYKVISGKSFPADKVDMKSAVTPVTPGKPGLNLITCHGKVIKGTSEFSERYIVYTEQL